VKPIPPSPMAPRHHGVGGQQRPRPTIATLGGLAIVAGVASMALVAFHDNANTATTSMTAVIMADPPSAPLPGGTGDPNQQPKRVCTHWDPTNNTTREQPCSNPS
jgi:hypothetical protein